MEKEKSELVIDNEEPIKDKEELVKDKEDLFKENLEYLNSRLKYLGFGENTVLNKCLEEEMKRGEPTFDLYTEAFYDEETKLEARLNFNLGKKKDRYFFTRYTALLRYPDNPEKEKQQTFHIDKGTFGVTFKEAFNLLQGRSVYKKLFRKDGEKYMSWIRLDFAEKTLSGNHKIKYLFDRFALEKTLDAYEIRELDSEVLRERIIRSLQRGNLHPVIVSLASKRLARKYIYANPESNTIVILTPAMGAATSKTELMQITEMLDVAPDLEPLEDEPVSDAIFNEEVAIPLKKAHL
jgi:hypothetical protein